MPSTDGVRRSTVTTGIPASTACISAGAIASTSFGLMMMPLTPRAMAASTSAVCFGDETCPSLSMGVPPSAVTAVSIAFIMWTKNGERPGRGLEVRISGLSCAKPPPVAPRMTAADTTTDLMKLGMFPP